jgi:hypothetical protein
MASEIADHARTHAVARIRDLVGEAADNTLTYAQAAAAKGGTT